MKKTVYSLAKVRFQDCDPFNHLNNSKYLDYFVNAREDQILEHYNLDVFAQVNSHGKSWVVTDHQITYIKPAMLNEEVLIISQLIEFSATTLCVEMKMYDKTKSNLKAILWTTFAYLDLIKQRKAEHSKELQDLFSEIVNPIEISSFERRCRELITNSKMR